MSESNQYIKLNKKMKKKQNVVTSISSGTCCAESFISEKVFQQIKENPKKIKSFEKDMDVTVTTAKDADGDCMLSVSRKLPSAMFKDFDFLERTLTLLIATVEGWKSPKSDEEDAEKKFMESLLKDFDENPSVIGAIIMANIGPVEIPCGSISAKTLKKLLKCYVEHHR